MPLRDKDYDYFSNEEGVITRTAGYTSGFAEPVNFGSVVFTAKKSGIATISFGPAVMVLDENGTNQFGSGTQARITIAARAPAALSLAPVATTTIVEATSSVPVAEEQLFDVAAYPTTAPVLPNRQVFLLLCAVGLAGFGFIHLLIHWINKK
jgi:hypothetical protein